MSEIETLLSSQKSEEALQLLENAPESADTWSLKGRALGQLERFDEALECAGRALKLDADCLEAHNTAAAILGRRGDFEQAFHHANVAAAQNPSEPRFFSTRATILGMTGRLPEALADYNKVKELGEGASIAAQRAQILGVLGQTDEALKALDEADPEESDPEMLAQAKAVIYSKLGDLPKATEASLEAARIAPDRLGAWLQVVQLQCAQGDLDGALETLNESLDLRPDNEDLFQARVQVLIARQEYSQVLDSVETERKRDPKPYFHHKISFDLLIEAGQRDLVTDFLEQNLGKDPESALDHVLRGAMSPNLEQAETYWNKAIELSSQASVTYEVGNAFMGRGLLDEAAPYYQKTTETDPEHHEAFHNWGLCLQETGHLELAVDKYNRCLELRPDLPDTYNNRGNCYRSLAQYEQSLADHSRAIELYPQNPQPRQNRALTYIELRELPSAQADLTRLLELDHQNSQGHHLLGLVHHLQNREELAQQHYRMACQLDASFSERPYELMVKKRVTGPPTTSTEADRRDLDHALTELTGRLLMEGLKGTNDPTLPKLNDEELHALLTFLLVGSLRLLALKSPLELGAFFEQFAPISKAMDAGTASLKSASGDPDDSLLGEITTWISAQFPQHFNDENTQIQFIMALAVLVNSVCAQIAPIVTTYKGPVHRDWAKQSDLFDERLQELGVADLPFRYDLGEGRYYWLRDEVAVAVAEVLVVGSYSEIGQSFMAGWASPGAQPGGAWPSRVPGMAGSYEELPKEEAWLLAAEIANHLDVEFLQSVDNGRLVMFLGFSNIRHAEDGIEFRGANIQAAANDVLSKVSTVRGELGEANLTPGQLSELCLDFANRVKSLAKDVHKNTAIAPKLVKSSELFKKLGKQLGKKKFFVVKRAEIPLDELDESLELLKEIEKDWVS